MPFVERDLENKIKGVYPNLQPGYAEEYLADDHPDIIAYNNPPVNLIKYLANARYNKEVGGTLWNGYPVATDRESQSKIIGVIVSINAGLRTDPSIWKFKDGVFRSVTNAEFLTLAGTVAAFIQECFNLESSTLEKIENDNITTTEEIDEIFE